MGVVVRTANLVKHFLFVLVKRFLSDDCLSIAASLSYTTLLALVPALAITFTIISTVTVFDSVLLQLQNFIFKIFIPGTGEVVKQHLSQFIIQASRLSVLGLALLVVAVLMLMTTIETAINKIWKISRPRPPIKKIVVYMITIILLPLFLATSIYITSYLAALPLLQGLNIISDEVQYGFLRILPLIVAIIACTILYTVVPYCQVSFRSALIAGVCAALFFESAKKGFVLYVANVTTYSTIYGALAVVPLFLLWIYVSWIIILLGVELSYCLSQWHVLNDKKISV